MWILATPARKPARVKTKRVPMTTRTKGRRIIPPPGCIIWDIRDIVFVIGGDGERIGRDCRQQGKLLY